MDDQPDEEETNEVRLWAVARLVELGYRTADAEELADRGADWHLIAELLERGCSRRNARRIAL